MNSAVSFWQCASAIDSLAAFYFNNITAGDNPPSPAALNLARHIGDFPSLFPQVCNANLFHHILKGYYVIITLFLQQILKTLFEIIIFEDAGNQWSLSRPILSLIMISEQVPAYCYCYYVVINHVLFSFLFFIVYISRKF